MKCPSRAMRTFSRATGTMTGGVATAMKFRIKPVFAFLDIRTELLWRAAP